MKRFNCKHGLVEMVESEDGYWVRHEDVVDIVDNATSMWKYYQKRYYLTDEGCDLLLRKILKFKSVCIGLSVSFVLSLILSVLMVAACYP
jgi:hypothetical protein